jgi:signal transduction histidine kinase
LLLGTTAALMLVVAMTFLLARQLRRTERIRMALEKDVIERRAAEHEVRALNQRLTENADALERTNRELEAFSYTISHDLRAPLRHIDGYARMLREDAEPVLDNAMRRYLDMISDGARRMGALIDDLLAFSRWAASRSNARRRHDRPRAPGAGGAGGARSPAHVAHRHVARRRCRSRRCCARCG